MGNKATWNPLVGGMLDRPLRWRKTRVIFVMTDLFHPDVPFEFIWKVFDVMRQTPRHTYQILTKRPQRMADFFDWLSVEWLFGRGVFNINWSKPDPNNSNEIYTRRGKEIFARCFPLREEYAHVWLGVSVEDQKTADERIPLLLKTPAAVRWISAEPLLGPVEVFESGIDWVVAGGESGPGARPMHPDWARSLRDQCQAAGVAYLFKQWGDVMPSGQWRPDTLGHPLGELAYQAMEEAFGGKPARRVYFEDGTWGYHIGKKAAGRLLDGKEWNQFPVTEPTP